MTHYCNQLGGKTGAFVKLHTVSDSVEACVFPDNSAIDFAGLWYISIGIIRGIDLSTVLKYQDPRSKTKSANP